MDTFTQTKQFDLSPSAASGATCKRHLSYLLQTGLASLPDDVYADAKAALLDKAAHNRIDVPVAVILLSKAFLTGVFLTKVIVIGLIAMTSKHCNRQTVTCATRARRRTR